MQSSHLFARMARLYWVFLRSPKVRLSSRAIQEHLSTLLSSRVGTTLLPLRSSTAMSILNRNVLSTMLCRRTILSTLPHHVRMVRLLLLLSYTMVPLIKPIAKHAMLRKSRAWAGISVPTPFQFLVSKYLSTSAPHLLRHHLSHRLSHLWHHRLPLADRLRVCPRDPHLSSHHLGHL